MSNVLLTGATGFIGGNLAKRLVQEGFKVYALIRHSPRVTTIPEGLTTIKGDLLDYHSLRKAVRTSQPSYVFNLAAMTPVRHSYENPFIYGQVNYGGTVNLVHASLECANLKRFFQASTMEVYKGKNSPLKEEDTLFGQTPYGISKTASDLYVRVAGDCYGLPYTILRPCNTYGRLTERGYLVEKIVTTMLTKTKLELNGRADSVRSFMYLTDHVEAYLACLQEGALNEVFNFGPEKGNSVREVVDVCRELLGWNGEVVYGVSPRPSEALKLVIDASKARKVLGWEAKVGLREGLKRTIANFRSL